MSGDRWRGIAAALSLRRNAAIGFGAGTLVALIAYAVRVGELLGPTAATRGSPVLFALLAVVLALSAGLLVTVVLAGRAALRQVREFEGQSPER